MVRVLPQSQGDNIFFPSTGGYDTNTFQNQNQAIDFNFNLLNSIRCNPIEEFPTISTGNNNTSTSNLFPFLNNMGPVANFLFGGIGQFFTDTFNFFRPPPFSTSDQTRIRLLDFVINDGVGISPLSINFDRSQTLHNVSQYAGVLEDTLRERFSDSAITNNNSAQVVLSLLDPRDIQRLGRLH